MIVTYACWQGAGTTIAWRSDDIGFALIARTNLVECRLMIGDINELELIP